ncbi:MAG: TRASH domain-containing protein [Sulfolobaceae archaeon]|nr:TRASH domain-containing protein [Sulfolobaceae archaeon]
MPFQLDVKVNALKCSWCGNIIRGEPIIVKTCCNNKPWVFCSRQCYNSWVKEWLKRQEQQKLQQKRKALL